MGEERGREGEVEGGVGVGEPVLGRGEVPERVVLGVVDRRPLELELRVPGGDVAAAPPDHRPADVEPGVGAALQVLAQRDRHPADPAADVEHPVGGLEAAELGEVAEELAPGRGEVAAADKREPAGRDQLTAAAQPVEQIRRGEDDPPRERLRQVEGPIPHRYSNGSDSATSARRRGRGVAGGEQRLGDPPLDADVGVVPGDARLGRRVVEAREQVGDVGRLAEDGEAVAEADRHVELAVALVVEDVALPLPEGRRAPAQVDGDVEDLAPGAADQLRLAGLGLEVDPPQRRPRGARVVVLDELDVDPQLGPGVAAVGLDHEAALVAVDLGLEQHDPLELGRDPLRHQPSARPYCFS